MIGTLLAGVDARAIVDRALPRLEHAALNERTGRDLRAITLDRPARGNAITLDMPRRARGRGGGPRTLDPEVHVIALAGEGKASMPRAGDVRRARP